jgi:type I restriction enzyme S subunit
VSRIADLISELVPNGVKFELLGDIAQIASARSDATTLNAGTYVGVDNLLPNFAGRKDSGYGANSSGAIKFQPGDILIGNIRPYLKKVWLADRHGGASPDVLTVSLLPSWREQIVPRFLYFAIASEPFIDYSMKHAKGAKMPRGDKVATLKYRIPVPPLEVQREIVRILDDFAQLEAELEAELGAELDARRRQYAFYRDRLLTFPKAAGIRRIPMHDLGSFIRGRRFVKDDMVAEGIPSIHYGEIYTYYGTSAAKTVSHVRNDLAGQLRYARPGDVVIASVGETVEDVAKAVAWLGDTDVAIHDDSFAFRSDADPTYIAYVMQTAEFHAQKERYVARAKVKRVGSANLGKIVVPVPTFDEQRRIVNILDKFDALMNDLAVSLPAERAARRKQYEYYRNKLLTFGEAAV